jgi:hypothetical protein
VHPGATLEQASTLDLITCLVVLVEMRSDALQHLENIPDTWLKNRNFSLI